MQLFQRQHRVPVGLVRPVVLDHIRGGTRTCWDDGCNAKGESNQGRQCIERALAKEILVVAKPGAEPSGVPVFRLHEPPKPMPYNLGDKRQAACARADKFDEKVLKQMGIGEKGEKGWILPSAAWLKVRELCQEQDRQIEAHFVEQEKRMAGKDVAEALQAVLALATKGATHAGKATVTG